MVDLNAIPSESLAGVRQILSNSALLKDNSLLAIALEKELSGLNLEQKDALYQYINVSTGRLLVYDENRERLFAFEKNSRYTFILFPQLISSGSYRTPLEGFFRFYWKNCCLRISKEIAENFLMKNIFSTYDVGRTAQTIIDFLDSQIDLAKTVQLERL